MQIFRTLGTLLLATIFAGAALNHVTKFNETQPFIESVLARFGIDAQAALLCHAASIVCLVLGTLLLVLGALSSVRLRNWGAVLLILFLIPVTFTVHAFWEYQGHEKESHTINFMKNLSLIGGLLFVANSWSGPVNAGGGGSKSRAKAKKTN